jgi:glycosyltransferase involved in cell wall biosynthesis
VGASRVQHRRRHARRGARRHALRHRQFARSTAASSRSCRSASTKTRALNGDVYGALHTANLFEQAGRFDLIHNNFDWKPLTYALATRRAAADHDDPRLLEPPILAAYYAGAGAASTARSATPIAIPGLDYLATTYNGIDPHDVHVRRAPGDYLVFLGRFHPEKGAHLAIEIAKSAGVR